MAHHLVGQSIFAPVGRRDFLRGAPAIVVVAAAVLAAPSIAVAETKTFDIVIEDGKVVGAKSVRVIQGDKVILNWTSDKAMELHLHGYDIERVVGPDKPAAMSIDARATGRFPISMHGDDKSKGGHGHSALFYLEIYPK